MPNRIALFAIFATALGFSQNPLKSLTFGGSGNDAANGVAVDSAGNIYVVGSTTSFDLPVLNASQAGNTGTQVIVSQDAGATWKPLATPFPMPTQLQSVVIAVDPTNAQTVYVGSGSSVCKSIDGGAHFQCVSIDFKSAPASITSLVVDPQQASTLYLSASPDGGVFRSPDGGQTWARSRGLPKTGVIDSVTLDPFHPKIVYAWVGKGAYVSDDGANSFMPSSLPWPANVTVSGGLHFSFDLVMPGILFGPALVANQVGFQKSVDGGQTWAAVNAPFDSCCVVTDPKVSGVLYALVGSTLWKSTDGGATWNSSKAPVGATGVLSIDPSNPLILIAGAYRSTDGGQTWTATNASRQIQAVFAPAATNTVYATAPITSDAFLAKFLPDGKTVVFLTYFGGMGNELGRSIALDGGGNIWIAGSTSSLDLPVTTGAFQTTLKATTNGFVAKFSNDGKLIAATYLGGSSQDSVFGIALGPNGNPWVIESGQGAFVGALDSALAHAAYFAPIDGSVDAGGKGIAIDSSGNVLVTGSTSDPNFPVTAGAYHAGAPSANAPEAFVLKLDASGQTIYSTYIGGSQGVITMPTLGETIEGPAQHGIAVAADSGGNAVVTGYTASADFPTTPGAYQRTVGSGCPYPAFIEGTIGPAFFSYLVDDTFVLKLSADGKTLLYSTLLGGSCYDRPTSIALDAAGNAYVTGETDSGDYPLVDAVEAAPAVSSYASFASVLNAAGSALNFSTYLLAGAVPSVAAAPSGSFVIAGDVGQGAQTQEFSGPFGLPVISTDGYLAVLTPPTSPPAANLSQVRNAFSLQPGPVAPGEIVSLGLPGFVPGQRIDIGLNVLAPLTTSLAGVQVLFDGRPAYLITVDSGRVVCIAPVEIAGQTSTAIQLSINGALSNILNAPVAATALGLLSADGSGTGQANARNSDGSVNSQRNPAAAGTTVTLYLTGAGVTNPAEIDGVVAASSNIVPVAKIASGSGTITSISALPGFVPGIFAIDFAVPANPPPTQGIGLTSGGLQSQFVTVYFK